MSSASSSTQAPAPAKYDVAFTFAPQNAIKLKPRTPAVTILGWLVLCTSLIGILAAASALFAQERILESSNHLNSAISAPTTRWFFTENWETICKSALALFALTGICALGILARLPAALFVTRWLLVAIAIFCVTQTLGHVAYDFEYTDDDSILIPWNSNKGLVAAVICLGLFKFLNLQLFKGDFTPVPQPQKPLIALSGALDIDSAGLKKPGP